ncbi:hypothetical protein Hanom_Chr09g00845171 [Helianthus anomalus]
MQYNSRQQVDDYSDPKGKTAGRDHKAWIKVFSFNTPHIVDYIERRRRTNIIQDNKWLITIIWGDIVEVDLCNESFKYLQHVDDYSDPKGA